MALYIVDGNNLKGYLLDSGQLPSSEDADLIAWLRRRQSERRRKRGKGDRMVLWFDAGIGDRRPSGDSSLIVRVAPPNLTADEAILRELSRLPSSKGRRSATLVTSDRDLQARASALGVGVMDCERFAGKPAPPSLSEVEVFEKERAARELGHSVNDLFLPARERKPRPSAARPHVKMSPRKVSLLRDPGRLEELLRVGDRVIRRRAVFALAKSATEPGRKLLEQTLANDPVPSVRAAAATALGQIGDGRSFAALQKAATDRFSLVRAAVAATLAQFDGPRASEALQALRQDSRRRVRRAALAASTDGR